MTYAAVMQEIRDGAVIVIDGATGTELERRGAPMHEDGAWCALATGSHPDILRQIHTDYILAGSRVVTANTFATTREVLEPLGFGDRFEPLNRLAVELAVEARDATPHPDGPVLVAGSISHTRPSSAGAWSPELSDVETFEADCTDMAAIHKDAGCDVILAEMMGDAAYTPAVMRAAKANDLPVWVGISALRTDDGMLRTYTNDAVPLADVLAPIVAEGGADVMGIMHSLPEVIPDALAMLKQHWSGPLLAYPDSLDRNEDGEETLSWENIIADAPFVAHCRTWLDEGVQVLGGCCGLTVSHIAALNRHLERETAPA
ncbi:MAG: homocysteine S-methyltransferase family protein [bacterium]|nr:homocysteine S-methyltransferase family protein [bacterium]MDE0241178.1 homocysteine S-methyltransferase family protein [bacterium]MDE0416438.1 homocysteine S-methyltransferase family protein [bacterium]